MARDARALSSGAVHFNNVEEPEAGASCVIRDTDSHGPDFGMRRQENNSNYVDTITIRLKRGNCAQTVFLRSRSRIDRSQLRYLLLHSLSADPLASFGNP